MNVINVDFKDFSNEKSLRFDFMHIDYVKKIFKSPSYSFKELFDIVSETDDDYLDNDFLYAEIGDVNKNNEVFPSLLNFNNRDDDLINEPLYKKISKGDIIKCKENDILISKIRPNLKKILFINEDHSNIYYTSAFVCLRPKIAPKILFYSLRTLFFRDLMALSRQGKGYPTLSEKDLLPMKFSKRIIDYLISNEEELLSKIEKLEDKIKILKYDLIDEKYIINNTFKEVFKFNYSKFEELKDIKMYNTSFSSFSRDVDTRFSVKFHRPAGQYVMKELLRITDKKIKHFISMPIITGHGISPVDYDQDGDFFYVTMADIKDWKLNTEELKCISNVCAEKKKTKKTRGMREHYPTTLEVNDILMARSGEGTIGKVALIGEGETGGIFCDFIMRIKLKNYNPQFAYYYFRTSYFQYLIEIYKKGLGNNTNIFPPVVQEFPIPDVSLKEQQMVVDAIYKEINKQNKIIEQIENKRKEIEELLLNSIKHHAISDFI